MGSPCEVLVEAGPTLAGALLGEALVDELLLYVAPVLLGPQARPLASLPPLAAMAERLELELLEAVRIGGDLRLRLRPRAGRILPGAPWLPGAPP